MAAVPTATAASTATTAPSTPAATRLFALLALDGTTAVDIRLERGRLLVFQVLGAGRRDDPGELLARQHHQRPIAARGGNRRGTGARARARARARGHRLRIAGPDAATTATATPGSRALGLLVGDLRHREVLLVAGDAAAGS